MAGRAAAAECPRGRLNEAGRRALVRVVAHSQRCGLAGRLTTRALHAAWARVSCLRAGPGGLHASPRAGSQHLVKVIRVITVDRPSNKGMFRHV